MGSYMHVQCLACIGGTSFSEDTRKLEDGQHVHLWNVWLGIQHDSAATHTIQRTSLVNLLFAFLRNVHWQVESLTEKCVQLASLSCQRTERCPKLSVTRSWLSSVVVDRKLSPGYYLYFCPLN